MGFFSKCFDALLQLTTFAGAYLGVETGIIQRPLVVPVPINNDLSTSAGLSFVVEGTNFTCSYPSLVGYETCNTAENRSCWIQGSSRSSRVYDINTDYENFSPPGVVREYWLEVDLKAIAPDGFLKELGQVFNGTYPGPHLQACWGDQMVVHVTNKIPNLGTTVHWHGIRQFRTPQHDGVNGITQCPIAHNQTFTYRFNITQYGHTWYHSHYQTQYSDGVLGALTLYGPSSAPWDETSTPIFVQDWVHQNSSLVFQQELGGAAPLANNILFNGTNSYKCASTDPLCCSSCTGRCPAGVDPEFCCTPDPRCFTTVNGVQVKSSGGLSRSVWQAGKRYLLKLVNSSAGSMFIFSIDDHELEVIASDLVPIKPFTTDALFIGIGQRYDVVVTAKPQQKSAACQKNSINCNYWVRTRIADGCGSVEQGDERSGIISYNASATTSRIQPTTTSQHSQTLCEDVDVKDLQPVFHWNVENLVNDRQPYTFDADITNQTFHGAFRWDLTDEPLFLNYSNPTILNIDNNALLDTDENLAVVNYTFPTKSTDDFVYLIITGQPRKNQVNIPAAHPIHLHGHDFVILAQVDSSWNGTIPPNQTRNPPRRDVALLYAGGYLALAFKLDNPGIWVCHCHIAWHASSGLALQVLEQQHDILPSIGSLGPTQETCREWRAQDLQFEQDDSGI